MSNATETNILKLIFTVVEWANIAVNTGSSPLTSIYVGLHTGDPGEAGSMSTSEAAYGSYSRVGVARTTGGWTVTGDHVNPVADITFAQAASGTESETYCSFGKSGSGAAEILFSGAVTPYIPVATGVTPRLTTATQITLD